MLMTTPLDTGEYMNSGGYAGILLMIFPVVALIWANLGSVIADSVKQENEEKLENILKRIGYRPIIEVYRSFIVMVITIAVVYTPVAVVMLLLMLSQVNVFIGLMFFYMIPFEMWVIDMLFKFMFGKKALIIKVFYYVANICLVVVMGIRPKLSNGKLTIMALFPLTQMTAFGKLVIKALN